MTEEHMNSYDHDVTAGRDRKDIFARRDLQHFLSRISFAMNLFSGTSYYVDTNKMIIPPWLSNTSFRSIWHDISVLTMRVAIFWSARLVFIGVDETYFFRVLVKSMTLRRRESDKLLHEEHINDNVITTWLLIYSFSLFYLICASSRALITWSY